MINKKLFSRTAAAFMAAVMLLSGTPASAATIKDTMTTKNSKNLQVVLKPENDDARVTLVSKNLKNGKTVTSKSDKISFYHDLHRNVWFKSVLNSYNSQNKKTKSVTYYMAKSPELTLKRKSGTRKYKISWKKTYGASGYVVYMGTNVNNLKKVKTLKGASSTSWTTSSLKTYTRYCFYVQSYKRVNGKTYYSAEPEYCSSVYLYYTYR